MAEVSIDLDPAGRPPTPVDSWEQLQGMRLEHLDEGVKRVFQEQTPFVSELLDAGCVLNLKDLRMVYTEVVTPPPAENAPKYVAESLLLPFTHADVKREEDWAIAVRAVAERVELEARQTIAYKLKYGDACCPEPEHEAALAAMHYYGPFCRLTLPDGRRVTLQKTPDVARVVIGLPPMVVPWKISDTVDGFKAICIMVLQVRKDCCEHLGIVSTEK